MKHYQDLEKLFETLPLLEKTLRWSRFDNIREQNTLQHSYVLSVLASIVTRLLKPYHPNLDHDLVKEAALIHDVGELGQDYDVLYPNQSPSSEIEECGKFKELFGGFEKEIFEGLKKAFLLQFAWKNEWGGFEKEEQETLRCLAREKQIEALLFHAIEHLDYVLFAREQFKNRDNAQICQAVIKTHLKTLSDCSLKIPGFGEKIWTPEIQSWCEEFLKT